MQSWLECLLGGSSSTNEALSLSHLPVLWEPAGCLGYHRLLGAASAPGDRH